MKNETEMTPAEFRLIREGLDLTRMQWGILMGFEGASIAQSVQRLEKGERNITRPQALLAWAYAGGWRPSIWPVELRSGDIERRIASGRDRARRTLDNGRKAQADRDARAD